MTHTLLFAPLPAGIDGDVIAMIRAASPVNKFVLLLLLVFSVISWAVILFKSLEYSRARRNALRFLDSFHRSRNFPEIAKMSKLLSNNPLGEIFRSGYKEMTLQMGPQYAPEHLRIEALQRSLQRAANAEIVRFERLNGFLATTAAATPFIGLFGTVWGIMGSFQNIGVQMNANLATVAPGIAEALIATAMGLAAAIPAVIAYNFLLNKLKVLIAMMEEFSIDFLDMTERMR